MATTTAEKLQRGLRVRFGGMTRAQAVQRAREQLRKRNELKRQEAAS